ncbi:hypothetical protein WMF11_25745 [Sorangium sp. So ce295]
MKSGSAMGARSTMDGARRSIGARARARAGERRPAEGPAPVDRRPERVDDAPEQRLADGHVDHPARPLDGGARGDAPVRTEQHAADRAGIERHREAARAVLEDEDLVELRARQAADGRDAVRHAEHAPDLPRLRPERKAARAVPRAPHPAAEVLSKPHPAPRGRPRSAGATPGS